MYIIRSRFKNFIYRKITIEPIALNGLWFSDKYYSPDTTIAHLIRMDTDDYRDIVYKEFNLKFGSYISSYDDRKIHFLYAETIEQGNPWKEWVDSILLLYELTPRED